MDDSIITQFHAAQKISFLLYKLKLMLDSCTNKCYNMDTTEYLEKDQSKNSSVSTKMRA